MTKLISLFAILAASGCVAKDSGSLGQAESKMAGDALGTGIEDGATSFGPVSAGTMLDAACVTPGGDTTDTDADSIPVNATLTFNCSSTTLGYTGTLTGTETVMDSQPAAIAWAFAATADLHASLTGPLGATIVRDWTGAITGTQTSAIGPFALARTLDAVTVFTGAGARAPSTTVTEANAWTITYTPQATWTPGGVVVTGSLTATGSWNVTMGSKEAAAMLSTPVALTLTPSCASRVTAGSIMGSYEGGGLTRKITVTWTGCNQHTVTYAEL